MAEIYLEEIGQENGQTVMLLKAKSLSKNFLGVAFDLQFDQNIRVDKFQLGEAFSSLAEEQKPIFLLKESSGKWIFGLTRRSDQLTSNPPKSELGKFYLSARPKTVIFENGTLSNFTKNARVDQENVQWSGAKFLTPKVATTKKTASTSAQAKKSTSKKSQSIKSVNTDSDFDVTTSAELGQWNEIGSITQEIVGSVALGVIVLVCLAFWLEKKFKLKEKILDRVKFLSKSHSVKPFVGEPK